MTFATLEISETPGRPVAHPETTDIPTGHPEVSELRCIALHLPRSSVPPVGDTFTFTPCASVIGQRATGAAGGGLRMRTHGLARGKCTFSALSIGTGRPVAGPRFCRRRFASSCVLQSREVAAASLPYARYLPYPARQREAEEHLVYSTRKSSSSSLVIRSSSCSPRRLQICDKFLVPFFFFFLNYNNPRIFFDCLCFEVDTLEIIRCRRRDPRLRFWRRCS